MIFLNLRNAFFGSREIEEIIKVENRKALSRTYWSYEKKKRSSREQNIYFCRLPLEIFVPKGMFDVKKRKRVFV